MESQHCIPPLDEKEFDKQWQDALNSFKTRTETMQTKAKISRVRGKRILSDK